MKAFTVGWVLNLMSSLQSHNILPGPDNLDQFQRSYLKKADSWFGPDVVLLTAADGVKFVLKDWSGRPAITRNTWCRIAASREIRVYRKLRGMAGVPQLICVTGPYGFIMEWLDARPLPRRKMRDLLGLEFFKRLESLVEEMHSRGIAHGDLRRRNILRGIDGMPRIIDFETAVYQGKAQSGTKDRIFQAVANIDNITVLKIRSRYFPDSVTPEEARRLNDVPWHLAAGRYLRQNIYGPLTSKGRRMRRKQKKSVN